MLESGRGHLTWWAIIQGLELRIGLFVVPAEAWGPQPYEQSRGRRRPSLKCYSVHSQKRASKHQRVHTRTALLSLLDWGRNSLVTFYWRGSPIVLFCVVASRPCYNLHCRSLITASQQRAHGSNRTRIALIWPICSRRIHSFRCKRTHLCLLRIAILGS